MAPQASSVGTSPGNRDLGSVRLVLAVALPADGWLAHHDAWPWQPRSLAARDAARGRLWPLVPGCSPQRAGARPRGAGAVPRRAASRPLRPGAGAARL